ncbi:MAG: oligosaccharide flippase family protein, partial [Actinomycetia bacterium]|nr:oligosaccharide flippase family protein [Actinomycetes bacterium]
MPKPSKALLRRLGWEAFANYASIVMTLVTTVIVASALGTSDFGLYAGTLSLMMLVAPFTALGYGQLLVREAANA